MSESVAILKFNPGETITQYLRRAKEFQAKINEKDYDLILDFLNELLGLTGKFKITSLRDFKRIKHNDLIINPDKNKELLKKYSDEFNDIMEYDISNEVIEKMKDEYIIHIIRVLLKKINYRLQRRKFSSGYYYYIKSQ